jgi:hypothetical protein
MHDTLDPELMERLPLYVTSLVTMVVVTTMTNNGGAHFRPTTLSAQAAAPQGTGNRLGDGSACRPHRPAGNHIVAAALQRDPVH